MTNRRLVLLVLFAMPVALHAQYSFVTNRGTISITKYTGPGGTVTLPEAIDGLPVTSIGPGAFYHCTNVTHVTIGDSVRRIENQAFANCDNLHRVTMGNSVTLIDTAAFARCKLLTHLAISDRVTCIGDDAFVDCLRLATVTIGKSVTNIGDLAFAGCTNLASITIPKSVTKMGYGTFASCWNLAGVYFQGDAPAGTDRAFYQGAKVTIYYLPTTKGWRMKLGDLTTAVWKPAQTLTNTAPK